MRVVVSRVKEASVKVDDVVVGSCKNGLLILSCFTEGDSSKEIDYLVNKCLNLRIFDDENGVMNKSVKDVNGSILSISQFTLYADASKGRRPSYVKALSGEKATILYDEFNNLLPGIMEYTEKIIKDESGIIEKAKEKDEIGLDSDSEEVMDGNDEMYWNQDFMNVKSLSIKCLAVFAKSCPKLYIEKYFQFTLDQLEYFSNYCQKCDLLILDHLFH